jgi:hypothetical protein
MPPPLKPSEIVPTQTLLVLCAGAVRVNPAEAGGVA